SRNNPSINSCIARPPLPCASVICVSVNLCLRLLARSTRWKSVDEKAVDILRSGNRPLCDLRKSPEIVISRTRAFRRHHARTDRRLRCTCGAKNFALPGLLHALQYFAALACLRIGNSQSGHTVFQLRIETRILTLQFHPTMRNRTETTPFKVFSRLKYLRQD